MITLQYLDMLVQKDNLQKSQFFKGLSKVLEKLPLVSNGSHCINMKFACIGVFVLNILVNFLCCMDRVE